MSISLEKLTQILAKIKISSSLEEEILTTVKDGITLPEANTKQSTFEESCILDKEHLFELEIEEDEEGISGEYQAIESCIEQWFQISTRLDRFCFRFYFINSYFQHLIFYIIVYSRVSFSKLKDNFGLLLLDRWLHRKFHVL